MIFFKLSNIITSFQKHINKIYAKKLNMLLLLLIKIILFSIQKILNMLI